MNLYIRYLLAIVALNIISACNKETDYFQGYETSIIVDGNIELDQYPKVILTRNIPYYVNVDSSDLIYLVLRQAKVTVSDGTQSEILTLKYKPDQFPPFFYQGNEIKGKAGNSYQLTINYGEKTLTSYTTIPEPVTPDSVWFQLNSPEDTLGTINLALSDNPNLHNYYMTHSMIYGKQNQYYPTLINTFDDKIFNGKKYTLHLNKGPESYLELNNSIFYFSQGDTVFIKLSSIDSTTNAFWNSYKEEVSNGANPFASSYHVINSNIEGPGKGIWGGYGSKVIKVLTKR